MKSFLVLMVMLTGFQGFAQEITIPTVPTSQKVFVIDSFKVYRDKQMATIFRGEETGYISCRGNGPGAIEIYGVGLNDVATFSSAEKCLQTLSAIKIAAAQKKSVVLILGKRDVETKHDSFTENIVIQVKYF